MRQRTITAIFFAAVMLGGIYGGEYAFFSLFAFIVAGCAWELGEMLFREESRFVLLRRVLCAALPSILFVSYAADVLGLFHLPVESLAAIPMLFGLLATVELFLAGEKPFHNVGAYFLSIFYLGLPFILLAEMVHGEDYYPQRVIGLLLLVWVNDVGAYLAGSRFGKHKLLARVSPKKTWEGTLGGGFFALLTAWGLSLLIPDYSVSQWLALGAVAVVGSNLGDLVESMLKRSVGVKDSGSILPGHGGFLDRFDAFVFCLPFFWLVLQVF